MSAPSIALAWRLALAAAAMLLPSVCPADIEDPAWVTRTWQSDEGLPNNTVTDIAQTADGYLWVATPTQLARFDGVLFEGFGPKRIVPAYDRKIGALLAEPEGGLWLGMNHGPLLHLRAGQVRVVTDEVHDFNATAIVAGKDGTVWIDYHGGSGSAVGGILYRVRDGQAAPVPSSSGGGESRSLACDRDGTVWLARDRQLSAFQAEEFRAIATLPARMGRIAAAREGGLWVCAGAALYRYTSVAGLQVCGAFASERATLNPTALFEDSHGAVWIGTAENGLYRWQSGRFTHVATSHPNILCLREDREANVWVGTAGGGLIRVDPRVITLETKEFGLPFAEVRSLSADGDGTLWAATETGQLAVRRGGLWSPVAPVAEAAGKTFTCVAADPSGAVWAGTQQRALFRLDRAGAHAWQRADGLQSRVVYALLVSRTGDVWIGGNAPESLQRLHQGELQTIALPAGVRQIRALAEDASGTIWAGSANGMLLRVEDGQAVDEAPRLGDGDRSIRCLQATADGSLWIGYAGWGLGRLKNGRLTRLTSEQGLYDDQISQIEADDRGWLWLGADHGIFRIRIGEFEEVAADRAHRLHAIRYGASEGLPSLQANFGSSPGTVRTHDGRIWLPMVTALAVVDPRQVRNDLEPPDVLLKRVVLDEQTVAFYGGPVPVENGIDLRLAGGTLPLPPDHRRLNFEFTALNFAAPENVVFQYRLDGLDDRWIEGASQRTVSYSRLPAGHYVFRVRVRDSSGRWNERESTLALTVRPFFWQTWWFRLALLALFTVTVVASVRYVSLRRLHRRLQALEQQAALDRERARIAQDIHDDVGASLTQVTLLSGLARRDREAPDKVGDHVEQIATAVRHATDSLDEIVWAVNPRNDTVPHLLNYLGKYAVEFVRTAGIKCTADLPALPPPHVLSAEVRHNVFLVAKEALHNAVRHARAREIRLGVTCDAETVAIAIEDDGRGFFESRDDAGGDGLRNMRERMRAIGGACEIRTAVGAGTRVCLTFRPGAPTALGGV